MHTLMKLNQITIREALLKKKITFFTPQDFESIFHLSKFKAKYFLERQTREGLFCRLKKGLYTLKTDFPREEAIANALYKPSYISFEYALGTYGIIPEMVYAITSATPKPTRSFEIQNKIFSYATIKKEAYTGYIPAKRGNLVILIAEPEKALVDYLYFVTLGEKTKNDRLYISKLNKKKMIHYATLYHRKSLINMVKELI